MGLRGDVLVNRLEIGLGHADSNLNRLAARGEKEQAVEHLLDIVRRDRNWNEQAARHQLVQLFDAWGPKDPVTNDGRRKLSSILFR